MLEYDMALVIIYLRVCTFTILQGYKGYFRTYIYMYGGYGDNSVLYNTVWRGTINRLTYKPIQ